MRKEDAIVAGDPVSRALPAWSGTGLEGAGSASLAERRDCLLLSLSGAASGEEELHLQAALGTVLFHLQAAPGDSGAAIAAFSRAFQLAGELGDIVMQARAYGGLCTAQLLGGDYALARATGAAFAFFLERRPAPQAQRIHAHMTALTAHLNGDQAKAADLAQQAYAQAAPGALATRQHGVQVDDKVALLALLARIGWLRAGPRQAQTLAQQAVETARTIGHPPSLCYALATAACPVAFWTGDVGGAAASTALLLETAQRHGLLQWQAWARRYAAPGGDDGERGVLADTIATIDGRHTAAHDLERGERALPGWCGAELLRVKGEAMLRAGAPAAAVRALWLRSLELAESQSAPAWQLRTAASLVRLANSSDGGAALADGASGHGALMRVRSPATGADAALVHMQDWSNY